MTIIHKALIGAVLVIVALVLVHFQRRSPEVCHDPDSFAARPCEPFR